MNRRWPFEPGNVPDAIVALRKMVLAFAAIAIALFAYTAWQSYDGRVRLREGQLAGCERGKLDRAANAAGWRTAERARRATGTPTDLAAADRYSAIAAGLEQRSRIDCARVFPDPGSFIP